MQHHVNYTMLTDFYELTMGNGYFQTGVADQICYFDIFFRSVPDGGGFAIAAGLEQVISYIRDLHFDEEDIAYLRSKNTFSEKFLSALFPLHRGHLGRAGGHPHLPPGAHSHRAGPCH